MYFFDDSEMISESFGDDFGMNLNDFGMILRSFGDDFGIDLELNWNVFEMHLE